MLGLPEMDMGPTVFPSDATRVISALIHFIGASICALCFARRTATSPEGADMLSFRGITSVSWARWCVVLVFVDSWIFEVFTGVLIHSVGLSSTPRNCSLGIIGCIAFYVTSKVLIYVFLTERVYIVWNAGTNLSRWKSRIYVICMLIVGVYAVVIVLMTVYRIAHLNTETGSCVIGLRPEASTALLTYDLFINVWLTSLFLWPLARATVTNSRLRRVALRTLVASTVALTTSTVNIAVLAIFHGSEPGWICLASCSADVTVNAVVLFWVTTSHSSEEPDTVGKLRTINVAGPFDEAGQVDHPIDGKPVTDPGALTHSLQDMFVSVPSQTHSVWRLRSSNQESREFT